MLKNYYQILGVSETATLTEIEQAYRKLALQNHPDKPGGNEARFKEIVEAYEVLSNPTEKQNYENAKKRGIEYNGSSSSGGISSGSYNSARQDFLNLMQQINRAIEEVTNLSIHSSRILENHYRHLWTPWPHWVNKFYDIESEEIENFKNQLLNAIKERLSEYERNDNNSTHTHTHTHEIQTRKESRKIAKIREI